MLTLDHIERLAKSLIIELHGIHCTDLLLEKGTSPEFNSRLKAVEGNHSVLNIEYYFI